jgi:uncharacterized repeat protein (TIGR02543 family)
MGKSFKVLAAIGIAASIAWGQTFQNPLAFIYEGFEGSGIISGWEMSRGWQSVYDGGVNNSRCLGAQLWDEPTTITTANVAMGASPVLSFRYRATTSQWSNEAAVSNALNYTVSISTDNGSTWAHILENQSHNSSTDFRRIERNLSAYANRTAMVRITFNRITNAFVWFDDIALGTVPPILYASETLNAGIVFNNHPDMTINRRAFRIENKGSRTLNISDITTANGITITGLSGNLAPFTAKIVSVDINATSTISGATYNGNFSFNTNDPRQPTFSVNVSGTTQRALNNIDERFEGSGTISGWEANDWQRMPDGGVNDSRCFGASLWNELTTITTANVAVGAGSVLSFWYRATTSRWSSEIDADLRYTVSVSADSGKNWTPVLENQQHIASADFREVRANIPFSNQIIRARITFNKMTDAFVWLDDLSVRSLPVTITFNPDGGNVSSTSRTLGVDGGAIGTLPIPTRENHTFVGWFTANGVEVTASTTFTSNAIISARWVPIFTVIFNPNGGAVSQTSSETNASRQISSLPTPTRENHAFAGWFTQEEGGEEITASTVFTSNATIFARWVPIYTITFNPSGGVVSPESYKTNGNFHISPLPTPTKAGYSFIGWFTEETDGEQITVSTVFNKDATVFARWELTNFTITYNLSNGTNHAENPTNFTIYSAEITLNSPTRYDHIFVGWFENSSFSGEKVTSIPVGSTENITLFARWEHITVTITYDLNGGILKPVTRNITVLMRDERSDGWGGNSLRISVNGANLPTNPTIPAGSMEMFVFYAYVGDNIEVFWNSSDWASDCAFAIFYTDNQPSPAFNPSAGASNNTERILIHRLYRSLTSVETGALLGSFTVGRNGNEPAVGPQVVNIGQHATLLGIGDHWTHPLRYEFLGWNTRADGTGRNYVAHSSLFRPAGDTTLFANWRLIDYEITYNLNGGTLPDNYPTTFNITSDEIILPIPTRDGFTFAGWHVNAFFIGAPITSIPAGSTINRFFWANWMQNPVSIRDRQETTSPYGILLENAIVSDFARISVITPEPATVNLRILDNLGNVIFTEIAAYGRVSNPPIHF